MKIDEKSASQPGLSALEFGNAEQCRNLFRD
jgi:hypothetical protein